MESERRSSGGLHWPYPFLRSLDGYRRGWLVRDAAGGILITAVAVPLSMGMAEVAGVPPVVGLYSCILPLVAYALIGSSRRLVIALDASTAAMLAAAIGPLARGDPRRYLELMAVLTVLVGLMLIVAGLLRLGIVADLLSRPVLLGYQAGLAVVVIASQLERLTGSNLSATNTLPRIVESLGHIMRWDASTVGVATGCLIVMLVLKRRFPTLPGALIAIIAATALASTFLDGRIELVGAVPSGLPTIRLPADIGGSVWTLLGPAAGIALVAATDTLAASRAFAARSGEQVDPSRDLLGLGAANAAAAVSGGMTTSASAARTAVAESIGTKSQVAGIAAAVTMALVLTLFTGPLSRVPIAALAAVVVAAVVRLIEVGNIRRLWALRRPEFGISITTAVAVVGLGVLPAIVIAMALSLVEFMRRTARPGDAILGHMSERRGYHDVARHEVNVDPTVMVYRFDAPLFYGNAERFRSRIQRLLGARPDVRMLVLDAAGITSVDATSADVMLEVKAELDDRGIELVLADLVDDARDTLDRAGVIDVLGPGGTADSVSEAVESATRRNGSPPSDLGSGGVRADGPPDAGPNDRWGGAGGEAW